LKGQQTNTSKERRKDELKILRFRGAINRFQGRRRRFNSATHITTVYERRTPLRLLDKISEEVRFVGEIKTLDTSFGDNATIIRLQNGQNDLSAAE
jgi:hypothetical protein